MARAELKIERAGQSTLEFTFSMMVALMLLLGMGTIFVWSGKEISQRTLEHEHALSGEDGGLTGLQQAEVRFDYMRPIF